MLKIPSSKWNIPKKIPKDSLVPPPTQNQNQIFFVFFNISKNNPITIEAAKMMMMMIPRDDLAKSGNKPVNGKLKKS